MGRFREGDFSVSRWIVGDLPSPVRVSVDETPIFVHLKETRECVKRRECSLSLARSLTHIDCLSDRGDLRGRSHVLLVDIYKGRDDLLQRAVS